AVACGLFSIRPTHGSIDARGVLPVGQSFDVVGILARKAADLSPPFEVLYDGPTRTPSRVKEVLISQAALALVEPEVAEVIKLSARAVAAALGADLGEVDFARFIDQGAGDTLAKLQGREIWANHSTWVQENMD